MQLRDRVKELEEYIGGAGGETHPHDPQPIHMPMINYQQLFQPIFGKLDFEPTKVFRDGPRFFIVGGIYKGEKAAGPEGPLARRAIFKADVEVGPRRLRKARFRLEREATFLEYANIKHVPKFFGKGKKKKLFWILEGWVPGESQEQSESTFLIKDTFFTGQNLEHLLEFLAELHRLGGKSIPRFEERLPRYTLVNYMSTIWTDRNSLLGEELSEKVSAVLKASHKLFNSNQTTITHHELYGPHIFVASSSDGSSRGKLSVIDWENVGWGGLAYDFTGVWIRSFAHQDFQGELFERFRASQKDKEVFDRLFVLELALQGIGNLRYFKHTEVPEEKQVANEVSEFLQKNIERAVSGG